jgi:hypothetical protein
MIRAWVIMLSLAFPFGSLSAGGNSLVEENLYHDFKQAIKSEKLDKAQVFTGFSSFDQSLFIDALWDLAEENNQKALSFLNAEIPLYYDLAQKFRLGILRIKHKRASHLPEDVVSEILNSLKGPQVDLKIIYLIAAYKDELTQSGHATIVELAQTHPEFFDVLDDIEAMKDLTVDEISDLFHQTPDTTTYMNGEYLKSIKLFVFCRTNRIYPCLMIMKDIWGRAVRLEDDSLWSNPALASSSKGLPSYVRNGNTPAGVMTIDSVMPYNDQQISFGKFRRLILNFIPKSSGEGLLKSLLPPSSLKSDWWKPTTVARDIGRNLLRIHGTGKINQDKNTPYFPFMRTSGCIAQRENSYDGVIYKDQRTLLDTIMNAMDLAATFENEVQAKGILYIVDIDDKNAPVTLEDLALRGIE